MITHKNIGQEINFTTHLANLGYEKLQTLTTKRRAHLADVFNDAYSLHTIQSLHWLPFCVNKMHIHKVITENSIYPLQYENPPPQKRSLVLYQRKSLILNYFLFLVLNDFFLIEYLI
ncbi:hypothetical protein ACTFIW_004592 [Dictyostelium discoideum]